jgi:hypothetical protein
MASNSPARITDDVTVEITRGPMTRLEAIRRIIDTGLEAQHHNPNYPARNREALQRLGITQDEITAAEQLP